MSYTFESGNRLWYEVIGEGQPLTLIGGFGIAQNQFDFAAPFLRQHHQLINWNVRGVGRSDWTMTEPYTLEQWVEDMRAVLDAAGIHKTSIWATSTGAPIGIRFAVKYPDRVDSLVTYPWFRSDETWKRIFSVTWQVAETFGLFTLARVFAGLLLPPKTLHNDVGLKFEEFETECFRNNINLPTLKAQMDALSQVDLTGDVRRLDCPTLLLMGNDSPLNDDEALSSASYGSLVDSFLRLKPDAEVCAIANTGSTYCMVTEPEVTSRHVMEYLRRVQTRPNASAKE